MRRSPMRMHIQTGTRTRLEMKELTRVKDPRTLDLGFGVSVVVKPLSFAVWRAASLAAERQAIQVASSR